MSNIKFLHNDPDDFHGKKLSLHDCVADRIYYDNNVLSFYLSDGFWIAPSHEKSSFENLVRTDLAQVDFYLEPDGTDFDEVYAEVFSKNIFRRTTVENWELDKLIKAVNSGDYQLEFVYQYRTHFEQMWFCGINYKGKWYHKKCYIHIPNSKATYRWNNLREDCVW